MKHKGFSQLPITDGREVIGVFSFRSFSLGVLRFEDERTNVLKLTWSISWKTSVPVDERSVRRRHR
jgi:hypothetical protein